MCIKAADRVLKGTRTHLVVAMETKRQRVATKSGCVYTQPTVVERQRKHPGRYEKQQWRPPGSQVGNTFSTFITLSDFDFPAKPVPFDPPSTLKSWKPAGKGGKVAGRLSVTLPSLTCARAVPQDIRTRRRVPQRFPVCATDDPGEPQQ